MDEEYIMKLIDLISYLESKDVDDIVERLQQAYTIVVNRIRLQPTTIPIRFTGVTTIPRLKNISTWNTVGSNSEIRIKEILALRGGNYVDSNLSEDNVGNVLVGDLREYRNSYGYDNFEIVNKDHNTVPDIIFKNDLLGSNLADTFLLVECYLYPYPCLNGDTFINEHKYQISEMIEIYGTGVLELDNVLGLFMLLETLRKFYADDIRINDEAMYDKITKDFLNLFNAEDNDILVSYLSSITQSRLEL